MKTSIDLAQVAVATGGTIVKTSLPKFKFDRSLDKSLEDHKGNDAYLLPTQEVKKLYQYAQAKRDYGKAIVESVSSETLQILARIVRNNAKK
jgi:hypothetical protein